MVATLLICGFSAYQFHSLLNVDLLYFGLVIGFVLFISLAPIYTGRLQEREKMYISHLRTLSMSKLESYASKAGSDKEKDLIDAIIGEKLYGHL